MDFVQNYQLSQLLRQIPLRIGKFITVGGTFQIEVCCTDLIADLTCEGGLTNLTWSNENNGWRRR